MVINYGRRQRAPLLLLGAAAAAVALCALAQLIALCPQAAGATADLKLAGAGQEAAGEQKQSGFLGGLKLSNLFDFSEYKRIYRKTYSSGVQELARMKLFFGGVLRVIIAAIKHRFFGKRYYLAVNRMTDWTEDEWNQLAVDSALIKGEASAETSGAAKTERFEAADSSDIDTKLPELFKGREETLQKFVEEMVVDHNNDDMAAGSNDHRLNAKMLFRKAPELDADAAGSPESVSLPKSNNPRYRQPELMSQSATSEPTEKKLESSDVEKITLSTSTGFLDNILDGLSMLFNVAMPEPAHDDKKVEIFSEGPDEIFVDHRESGCFKAPSHQLECGSCYAFASLALYEYLFCMQRFEQGLKKEPVQFSPQYLIDCGHKKDSQNLKGCKGGSPLKVAEFVNHYGLELEANYPYVAEQQMCPYDGGDDAPTMGYIRVNEPGLETVKPADIDDMLMKQPVLINIYPNSELKFYGGGIYDNYACEFRYGHAMLLVGSGRKDNQEYWIIRNSMGAEWGEQGYLYISKGAALNCMVDDSSTSHAKFPSANVNPKYAHKEATKLKSILT